MQGFFIRISGNIRKEYKLLGNSEQLLETE